MAVVTEISEEGRKLTIRWSGVVDRTEINALNKILRGKIGELGNLRLCLNDFEAISDLQVTPTDVQTFAHQDESLALLLPPGISIAFLVPSDHIFGMARMWQVLAEGTNWHTRIFRSRSEAEEWLGQQGS